MTRLIISYCFDLTRADSSNIEVGVLTVNNDKFARFNWSVDWEALPIDPMSKAIFRGFPEYLPLVCDSEWPAHRDRSVPAWRKEHDPKDLVEFLCHMFRHSSLYVSAVMSEEASPLGGSANRPPLG
ncbi:hypothetical protein N9917_00620 [Deltaproteobacteria bacterium]|nr:hypothetical protein [Deltaproteobacteria bacterium]